MGLFEHWPYTNYHDLNLDWILKQVKDLLIRVDKLEKQDPAPAPEPLQASGISGSVNAGTLARLYDVMDSYRKHNNDLVYMHKPSAEFNYATGLQADGSYYGYSAFQTPNPPTYGYCGANGTPYQDAQGVDRQGKAINCTTFVILSMLGIPYEYTTYNTAIADTLTYVGKAGYSFNIWKDIISAANCDLYYNTQRLYERFEELGLAQRIDSSFQAPKAGDVLFQSRNGEADGIFHCGICLAVAPLQVQLNKSNAPTLLICEVRNAPYPVTFRWRSAADLLAEGWTFTCSPEYGVTLPYASELLFERADSTLTETLTGLDLHNGEVITLDFDYTPRSMDSHLDVYINGVNARTPNRPLYVTEPVSAAELGVTRHITFPMPIQANTGMVSDPNTTISSITLIFADQSSQNNDMVTNLKIWRGVPSSDSFNRPVIRAGSLAELESGIEALFPETSRNFGSVISAYLAPTAGFTIDSVTTILTIYPIEIQVSNIPNVKRCIATLHTYSGDVTGKFNGSSWTWTA